MSGGEEQNRNLALFVEELGEQLGLLNGALLELEADPASPGSTGSLMRSAHTVKGTARMVGLIPLERLAHAIEELLLAALAAEVQGPLPPEAVALLFRSFDRLEQLSQAPPEELPTRLAGQTDGLAELEGQLRALAVELQGSEAAGGSAGRAVAAPSMAASRPVSAAGSALAAAPAGAAAGGSSVPAPAAERIVKLDALQLNRIAALAGESMVAVRWLQPFADGLQQLRSRQRELTELIGRWQPAAGAMAGAAAATAANDTQLALIRAKERQCQLLLQQQIEELEAFTRRSNTIAHRLYGEVLNANMRPFHEGLSALPRLVRDLAASLGKRVRLEIVGRNTLVDRDILRRLEAPVTHAVRNALDHGLETPEQRRAAGKPELGSLRIEAMHRGGMLSITIRDDGAGVDLEAVRRRAQERGLLAVGGEGGEREPSEAELLALLLRPGFSTAAEVSELSGRGVGLDVVETMAREVGGSLRLSSVAGAGLSLHLQLPLTLSVVRTLLVRIGGEPYALPLARLDQIVAAPLAAIERHEGRSSLLLDGRAIGLIQAQPLLGRPCPAELSDPLPVMVLSDQGKAYGLVVERFLGEQDLVVRPLDPRLGTVPCIASAALMGDGAPILVLDPGALLQLVQERLEAGAVAPLPLTAAVSGAPAGGAAPAAGAGSEAPTPQTGDLAATGAPRFPAAVRPTAAAPIDAAAIGSSRGSGADGPKRVLVVDDSRMVRESLARALAARGYGVEKATDGEEALELLRRRRVNLVVSDVEMPRLDGFALVRRLRALEQPLGSLPVLILSSRDGENDRLEGLQAGADRYLAKGGFREELLLEAVHDLIGPA